MITNGKGHILLPVALATCLRSLDRYVPSGDDYFFFSLPAVFCATALRTNSIVTFSSTRNTTVSSETPTILPQIPPVVTTLSPLASELSISRCSCSRFFCGRIVKKYITAKKTMIIRNIGLLKSPPGPGCCCVAPSAAGTASDTAGTASLVWANKNFHTFSFLRNTSPHLPRTVRNAARQLYLSANTRVSVYEKYFARKAFLNSRNRPCWMAARESAANCSIKDRLCKVFRRKARISPARYK